MMSEDKALEKKQVGFLIISIFFGVTGILWFILSQLTFRRAGNNLTTSVEFLGATVSMLLIISGILSILFLVLGLVSFFQERPNKYTIFFLLSFVVLQMKDLPGNSIATLAMYERYPPSMEALFSLFIILLSLYALILYSKKIKFLEESISLKDLCAPQYFS